MLSLVQHLVRLKETGKVSCFNLVYTAKQVHITFYLKTESNSYVVGNRSFKETDEFESVNDFITELWSTEDLVELEIKSMT